MPTPHGSSPASPHAFSRLLKTAFASVSLLAVVACAPTAQREGTGEYIDDSLITTKVKAALAADPTVKATEVKVETFKGTVQLSGFVSTPEARRRAIELARATNGVRGVKDDMVIK
ncbi:MAG: BON domain-containing protein [Massilia sp.]